MGNPTIFNHDTGKFEKMDSGFMARAEASGSMASYQRKPQET
jgi:hypothetical protein